MEIQQLRIVQALAEEGSMTLAAERLAVTQPAISFALSSLETELGYKIFHRSRQGLTLTTRGQTLLEKSRALLKIYQEIKVGESLSKDQGVLRVAGRQGFMQYVFPLLERMLRDIAPSIRIESAISGDSQLIIELLQSGKVDIAFGASPGIKSITAEVMYEDPVLLAVASEHPLRSKKRIALSELAELPFCLPLSSDRLRTPIDRFLKKLPKKPTVILETNDYTVMRNLIELGECAGFVYGHMLLMEKARGILPLRIEELRITRDLTVLHRRDDLMPHALYAREIMIQETKRLMEENTARILKR